METGCEATTVDRHHESDRTPLLARGAACDRLIVGRRNVVLDRIVDRPLRWRQIDELVSDIPVGDAGRELSGLMISAQQFPGVAADQSRSEERRVGKDCVSTCRYRWSPDH